MHSLFPINHKAGLLVDCCYHTVSKFLANWLASLQPIADVACTCHKDSVDHYFGLLDNTRTFTPNTIVVVKYSDSKSLYFDNHLHQYEPQSDNSKLCHALGVNTCYLHYDHLPTSPFFQSAIFSRYWHDGTEVRHRYVSCIKDSSWVFRQSGSTLPFEHIDRYSQRRIKDRMNCSTLLDYALHAGYDLTDLNDLTSYYLIRHNP